MSRRRAQFPYRFAAGLFDELVVDNFAGGGGASLGIELALGRSVDVAINHNAEAVALHTANHPETRHHCEDVFAVDPVEATNGRPVGLAWFSPDCKHFSRAKGGKPVEKKIRGLAWVVIKWAKLVRPRVIMLENVREFVTWGPLVKVYDDEGRPRLDKHGRPLMVPCPRRKGETFLRFVAKLERFGYEVRWRNLDAADFGAPTHRRRLFLVARRDGAPIRWPEPTHGPGRPVPYRTAAECIDWSLPTPSIFLSREEGRAVGCNRPLAEKTMKRIAMGLKRFVLDHPSPFIVRVNHGGDHFRGQGVDRPLRTLTGSHGWGLAAPYLVAQNGERDGQDPRATPVDAPINVVTPRGGGGHPLVAPHLVRLCQNGSNGANVGSVADPLTTIVSKAEHCVVAPHITKYFGGVVGQGAGEPLPTVTAVDHNGLVAANLVRYYGDASEASDESRAADRPLGTVVASDEHALVSAFLATHHGDRPDGSAQVGRPLDSPAPTATGRSTQHSIAAANLIKMNFGDKQAMAVDEPLRTILAGANHHGLVASHLSKFNTRDVGSDAGGPCPTLTGRAHVAEVRAFLLKYYGAGTGQEAGEPLHTVTANDRFGLVTVDGVDHYIADIGLRMLRPRELYRCQGFPDAYRIDVSTRDGRRLPASAQVRMVGNSVCPDVAAALVRANMAEIAAWPTLDGRRAAGA